MGDKIRSLYVWILKRKYKPRVVMTSKSNQFLIGLLNPEYNDVEMLSNHEFFAAMSVVKILQPEDDNVPSDAV